MSYAQGKDWALIQADCLRALAVFPENRFDSCVTDPPYELGFMGKKWDASGIAFSVDLWRAVLRVLKPGAHLLAFGGTRTAHRMACAIEDAGFEIRDCLTWNYKTGFPKSLDVSKAIDEARGEKPPVVVAGASGVGAASVNAPGSGLNVNFQARPQTAPVTAAAAAAWKGWGTGLKPALEPIYLCRKPLIGTVAKNVETFGTGALNIDACRIGTDIVGGGGAFGSSWKEGSGLSKGYEARPVSGRWPANALFDDSDPDLQKYFFCAKPSRKERDAGCDHLPARSGGEATDREDDSAGVANPRAGAGRTGGARNFHPTVKPVELMRYLVRLVTPVDGTVLDPFCGSGTTGIAARLEARGFLGIEREPDYFTIAEARIRGAA